MCYSAIVEQRLKKYQQNFGARVDFERIEDGFRRKAEEGFEFKVTKSFEDNFINPEIAEERRIEEWIRISKCQRVQEEESQLEVYQRRLSIVEGKLIERNTKSSIQEQEICLRQIDRVGARLKALGRIRDSESSEKRIEAESRIYAKNFTPLMIGSECYGGQTGERWVVPARYLMRPEGQPESFDRKFSGAYNAREDHLEKFPWQFSFGKRHGILLVQKFFENVNLHDFERRKLEKDEKIQNVVLCFKPREFETIFAPCLYAHSNDEKGQLFMHSFALITTQAAPEVMAAGHSRSPIFLKASAIDDWLFPGKKSKRQLYQILNEREMPYYEGARMISVEPKGHFDRKMES